MTMLDITEYFYQKLSYYIIFTQNDIQEIFGHTSVYFTQPLFWEIFDITLNDLCSKGALIDKEVNRVYCFLSMIRYSLMGKENWSFINKCIGKLNQYPKNIQIPHGEFYVEEAMKRFPKTKRISLSLIKQSLSLDFILLWAFISEDDENFKEEIVPSIDLTYPFIGNIRAFYIEARGMFATQQFIERLKLLLDYWEHRINHQDIGWLQKQQVKQKIKAYHKYL